MSGLRSRRKGKRNEYLLRDYFRQLGFTSERVPSSGAARGFKGDVVLEKGGVKLTAELKARESEFKTIYAFHALCGEKPCIVNFDAKAVVLSADFLDLGYTGSDIYKLPQVQVGLQHPDARAVKKMMGLQKFVKECDFLVIKIDRKPFLFLRYL